MTQAYPQVGTTQGSSGPAYYNELRSAARAIQDQPRVRSRIGSVQGRAEDGGFRHGEGLLL